MDHFKSVNVNPQEEEARIRSEQPYLLHETERIELAFRNKGGKGRDKQFFTTHRLLVEDGKGMGGKRKNFQSAAYGDVVLYAVQTAGGGIDNDTELYIWTASHRIKIDFSKDKVDLFEVYQFMNRKVSLAKMELRSKNHRMKLELDEIDPVPPNMDKKDSSFGKMMDWMGDNAKQIDSKDAETYFKTKFPILLRDEIVEIVFKSGRDFTVFTNLRLLKVDVKGMTGKKVEFLTIPYDSIDAFAVQTAGKFLDRDTEMKLHLSKLGDYSKITQDFAKDKANLWAVQKVLCNHILGEDKEPLSDIDNYTLDANHPSSGGLFSLLDAISNNMRPIDRISMERALKSDPPILQGSEYVEMVFQGRRDITLFTTKRVLLIDKKGFFGKKMMYISLPWEKFVAFGVRTAGVLDFDTEVQLYTELHFYPGESGTDDTPPIPARPEESCLELDFSTQCVDIFQLKYYLSKRIVEIDKLERGELVPAFLTGDAPSSGAIERLFQWLGDDQRELDPTELNNEFHSNTKILLDDEYILMAFKAGRDVSLFTNLRVMVIDVQGLSGRKIMYSSLPYRSIRGYAVTTAGQWDRDSEVTLYTRNRWHIARVKLEFRSGKTDVMQIQKLLSAFIVGRPTDNKIAFGPKNYGEQAKKPIKFGSLKATMLARSWETDAGTVNTKYHDEIPLLLEEENVLRAFESGRDMYVYTNRRLLLVDTKGMSGKSTKYKSIPYQSMIGYEFETSGSMMDKDAEIYTFTNVSNIQLSDMPRSVSLLKTKQSIAIKTTDIYEIGKLVLDHTVFDKSATPNVDDDVRNTMYRYMSIKL